MPRLLLGILVSAVASGGGGTPPAHPCEACHREIVATFRETAHFRTSADASARSIKGQFAAGRNVLRTGSKGIYFRMERRDNVFYQTAVDSARGDAGKPTSTGEAGCCSSCPPRISWGSSDGSTVPATWTARSTLGDSSCPTVWNATARRFRSARSPARRGTPAATCSASPAKNVMETGAPTSGIRRLIPRRRADATFSIP